MLGQAARIARATGADGVSIHGLTTYSTPDCHLPYEALSQEVRSTVSLDEDPERVWSRLSRGMQRSVKRSLRQGLEFSVSCGRGDFIQMHRLETLTRKRQGLPVPSARYFLSILETLEPGRARVMLAREGGIPVAGIMAFDEGSSILGVFAASDPGRLRLLPNNYLFWRALEWSCDRGYESFDMGLTRKDNTGLLAFKRGWGTLEEDALQLYHPQRLVTSKDSSLARSGLVRKIFSRVPLPIFRMVGPWVIRQLTS